MTSHLEDIHGKMVAITLSGYYLIQKSSITRNTFHSITIAITNNMFESLQFYALKKEV